jgi:predicted membrane-bound dolichyl-phosphate-mannose-protein mannosyltransferase
LKKFLRWFTYKENIAVCLMAALMLVMHLVYIANPPTMNTGVDPPTRNYLGDETFYVSEANLFLQGKGMERDEHPPVAKWLIAASIFFFGDDAYGWRAFPIAFAIMNIFLFYLICRRLVRIDTSGDENLILNKPRGKLSAWFKKASFVPVVATFLFASENMSFVMGHIAMLDVFCMFFMLLGFLMYLRGNYLVCGIAMGLSMLCKAMALLAVLAIAIYIIWARHREIRAEIKYLWNKFKRRYYYPVHKSDILKVVLIPILACIVWFVLLPVLNYPAIHQWVSPIKSSLKMLTTHLSLNDAGYGSSTGIASNPWMWLIWPDGIYYWPSPRYLLAIGWTVWLLVMPSMGYLIYQMSRYRKTKHELVLFVLSWFAGVYGLLIVLKLTTGRLMYHFYFYPAIPAVCLAIAWAAWSLWGAAQNKGRKSRIAFGICFCVYIIGTIVTFVFMSPLGTDLIALPT